MKKVHWQLAVAPWLLAASLAAGCGDNNVGSTERTATPQTAGSRDDAAAPNAITEPETAREDRPRVVALGDSLTAGLGLSSEQAFPALLQERIDAEGLDYEVVNAGVSGDTSAGG